MYLKQKKKNQNKLEKVKDDYNKFFKYVENESKGINYELFKDYFYSSVPSTLAKKKKYETKDKKENNELLNVIKRGFIDLKNKIKEMSED